ncbi:MAG TPA: Do family serine endopeptidase [Vicinamibacteria bacterium]|nr:Do family serine endopeptidase [Vicinamibacteria bacterium]
MDWESRDRIPAQRPRRLTGFLMLGALIAGSAAAGSLATSRVPAPVVYAAPVVASASTAPASGGYADVVAKVAPAVVTVRSQRVVKVADTDPFGGQDPFEEFFGRQFPGRRSQPRQPRREGALGSGVVVTPDGYILTNNHVVEGSRQVEVELTDGRTMKATVVGADAPSDLAVLKVEAKSLQTLPLGDSDNVRVGDVALAVGNPLGVGQTVTMGIISAKGRATGGGDSYEDFIQTDAPINQGNSGGALVNTRGELVGINSQILSTSGGNIGIGFAIPSNMAKNVMDQLVSGGAVHRGMLGVTVQGINSDLAASLGLSGVKGALVSAVSEDSPAEKAGVKRGDVIVAIDGKAVQDSNSLRNTVSRLKPGSTVALTLFRSGQERQVSVRLGEMQARTARDESSSSDASPAARGALGLALQKGESGLEVTNVDPDGPAADAGIRVGDVLEEVNGTPVTSSADVRAALGKSKGKAALVLVRRGEQTLYVAVPERAA